MSLEDRTKADVDRRIDRLREEYGEFPVRDVTVENDPQFFEQGREMAEEGWRGDAARGLRMTMAVRYWFATPTRPTSGASPAAATNPARVTPRPPGARSARSARREAPRIVERGGTTRETGIEVEITGVWRARRKEIVLATDPDRRFQMLTVWFEARRRDAGADGLSVSDDEIRQARWFADPPDAVLDFLEPKVRASADETAV
jgi:hypothetical protein